MPGDASIWIQLGHTEKELNRISDAEAAYSRAAELAPRDADALRHLGHLLKRQDRPDDAFAVFLRLFQIAPDQETMFELQRLMPGHRRGMKALVPPPGAILFTMQDFFASFTTHNTMTGIQRVQAGVALAALDDPACDAHFVINDDEDVPRFLRVEEAHLRAIIDYIASDSVEQGELLKLLVLAQVDAVPIEFGMDNTIIILGAFWDFHRHIRHLLHAKEAGARLGAYLYDLIPITHPQYCGAGLSNIFWRTLAELLHIVDFLMTISDFTRQELQRIVRDYGGRLVPTQTVALAHSLHGRAVAGEAASSIARIAGGPYVAYVSTIEGRKNHVYVVEAWQRLIASGMRVPDLVFVGRLGWNIDALSALLTATDHLDGRIHLIHGLSDLELGAVYAGASFTVFTSLMEGWGLPVGESLVYGTPCVASRAASIKEVGGDFVDYVDPTDLDDGVTVLARMIEDDRYREERRRNILEDFIPRTWPDVTRNLLAALAELQPSGMPAAGPQPVALKEGEIFRPGELVQGARPLAGYFESPMGLAIASSFRPPETDGAWMRARSGEITFRISPDELRSVTIFVTVRASIAGIGLTLEVDGGQAGAGVRTSLVEGLNFLRIACLASADSDCTLLLRHDHDMESTVGNERYVALVELSYSTRRLL